jgi:hypothetical protein
MCCCGTGTQGDVDMGGTEAVVPPIVIHNPKEPVRTASTQGPSSC